MMLRPMRDEGLSLCQIAARLDGQKIKAPRGGPWTVTAVKNVLARI